MCRLNETCAPGLPVAMARSAQLRRQDPRVVDHEDVAGLEQIDEIGDMLVLERPVMRHDQHARAVPRLGRMERDAVVGQLEVEGVNFHGGVRGRACTLP